MKSAKIKSVEENIPSQPKAKNMSRASKPPKPAPKSGPGASDDKPVKLLAGGNRQNAKARGGAVLTGMTSRERASGKPASRVKDPRNRDLVDWREETLARMRALILEADPEMIEERKWRKPSNAMAGVPVWSHHGIVCTGETYTKVVKLTFAQGASIADPSSLFNSSLGGNMRRAIDIHEGEKVDARAFKKLVKDAVARNRSTAKKR